MLRFLLLICLAAAPAVAQPMLKPVSMPFNERWTERVPVSGRTLVGLVSVAGVQPPDGAWMQPGSMALPTTSMGSGPVCVRATTQDGRYFAENSFASTDALPAEGRAGLAWPTSHGDDLKGFSLREVAVIARSGSCTEATELIPVMLGNAPAVGTLQVLVNTRGAALTAALRDPETGRTLRRANCIRVEGAARVAFDVRCVLGDAAGLPARVRLRLEQTSRDGLQTEVLETMTLRLAG